MSGCGFVDNVGQTVSVETAAEELRIIEEARDEVWLRPYSQRPFQRRPYLISFWLVGSCVLMAVYFTNTDVYGWKSLPVSASHLVFLAGLVLVPRWLMREQGIVRPWSAPSGMCSKSLKEQWPVALLLIILIPLIVFWLMGKPFWITFAVMLALMVSGVLYRKLRFPQTHPDKSRLAALSRSTSTNYPPKLLAILASLEAAKEIESGYLIRRLDITATDLFEQVSALHSAGLITGRTAEEGRPNETWYSMTPPGRHSFSQHKKMLRELIDET